MEAFYSPALDKWHEFVKSQGQQVDLLKEILAEEVVFHSPVVWTPQKGRPITMRYLTAAAFVLGDFQYRREFSASDGVVLEFSARVGETIVEGVDIIQFNSEGKIIDFEVMVRPARALQALAAVMAARLSES
ncbi:MAG TPA: nuclear transport factor 2 family protein [Chloroflexia bacterium]|nr:nuclear transport factor 2 family protein [Chloroflexia bacterium]